MAFVDLIGKIPEDDPSPLYMKIQKAIKNAIVSKKIAIGDIIPPERDLAEALQVSRITIRKAIDVLVNEKLLEKRQGSGTFVANRVEKSFLKISSFTEDMLSRGYTPHSVIISKEEGLVSPMESMSLGIPPGASVYRIIRIRYADDIPMAYEIATIDKECLTSLDAVGESLYDALEKAGNRPVRALQRLRAIAFKSEVAAKLNIPEGSPGLYIERRAFLANGRPCEYTQSFYRGDTYDMVAELNYVT